MTTTIYLDVDGVLNAVARVNPSMTATGWDPHCWDTAPINGYPIRWNRELINALNELAGRDDVEFKWLTTWTNDAAKILAPEIGINGQDWDVLDRNELAVRPWWKLEAIRADVESTQPDRFVWIDDDLSMESRALEWLESRPNGMGISPFMREGLTREHLKLISAFIDAADEEAA